MEAACGGVGCRGFPVNSESSALRHGVVRRGAFGQGWRDCPDENSADEVVYVLEIPPRFCVLSGASSRLLLLLRLLDGFGVGRATAKQGIPCLLGSLNPADTISCDFLRPTYTRRWLPRHTVLRLPRRETMIVLYNAITAPSFSKSCVSPSLHVAS